MACSKYEYTKQYEADDTLLRGTYIVVRVDGRGFSRFTAEHGYAKPNDMRGLALMNQAAAAVMADWGDAVLAFGESDEYSFVLPRSCSTYSRRSAKISTTIASSFASNFVFYWPRFFPDTPLRAPPAFDARCVCYPTLRAVADCIRWRQVDTHINSLHNEIFWALVLLGGMPNDDASKLLAGTVSEQKHELLFSRFGINYAKLPALFRRGTTLLRSSYLPSGESVLDGMHEGLQLRTPDAAAAVPAASGDAAAAAGGLVSATPLGGAPTDAAAVASSASGARTSSAAEQPEAAAAGPALGTSPAPPVSSPTACAAPSPPAPAVGHHQASASASTGSAPASSPAASAPAVSAVAASARAHPSGASKTSSRKRRAAAAAAELATGAVCGGVGADSAQWGTSPRLAVPTVALAPGILMLFPDLVKGPLLATVLGPLDDAM